MPQVTVVPLLKKHAPTVVAPTLTGLDVKLAKPVPVGDTIEMLPPELPTRPPDADVLNPTLYVVNAFAAEDGGVTATVTFDTAVAAHALGAATLIATVAAMTIATHSVSRPVPRASERVV